MLQERYRNIFEVVEERGYMLVPPDRFVVRGQVDVDKVVADPLGAWMNEIGMIELLTPDEEKVAIKAIKNGKSEDERKVAHDLLVLANQRMVMSVVFQYLSAGNGIEDMIQEGNIGLEEAVRTYNPYLGCKFSTYAKPWVRKCILAHREKNIKIPQNLSEKMAIINRVKDRIKGNTGKEAMPDEIADYILKKYADNFWVKQIVGSEATRIARLSKLIVKYEILWERGCSVSLDDTSEQIPSRRHLTDKQAEKNIILAILETEMWNLPPRERRVIELYYGFKESEPLSMEEVGKKLGVTRERIRQLINQAIGRLANNPTVRALW